MKTKRICIDARLLDGQAGGIQQVVCGIAQGLSRVDTSQFEIGFSVCKGESDWLTPYLSEDFQLIEIARTTSPRSERGLSVSAKGILRKYVGHLLGSSSIRLEAEPGLVNEFAPDLVHFVHQNCFETKRPYIFTPHDLQHEYFPDYFDKRTLMVRRRLYQRHAENSAAVVCISESCRSDVARFLGVEEEKCPIIYNAPLNGRPKIGDNERQEISAKYDLPERFLYYPAKTYPHKNHRRLIEALECLKTKGLHVPLVCSGPLTEYFRETLQHLLRKLEMGEDVRFVGWVSEADVSVLYDLATALVFPSEFEGFGLPLIEAMRSGLPVCCSNAACIPEIVGDAALMFDAQDVASIGDTIAKIWENQDYRESLSAKGLLRSQSFSWEGSAQQYLDLYNNLLFKAE